MSGNLIGGVVGAAVGFVVSGGNPMGAVYGWSIGSVVGGLIFPTTVEGPRLQDLKVQSSEYGRPIPIVYGHVGVGGNVIWAMDLIEVEGDSGGGKGGAEQTVYSYFANFAVAVAEGPVALGRIWAGPEKRLIYDGTVLEGTGSITFYEGTADQLPDPLIEADVGVGNAPAYRGTAYAVFEMFPLEKDGNRIPFLTFEVGTVEAFSCPVAATVTEEGVTIFDPPPVKIGDVPSDAQAIYKAWQDSATGLVYWVYRTGTQYWLGRADPETGTVYPDPLELPSGPQVAWDGNGTARAVELFSTDIYFIDLVSWSITGPTQIFGTVISVAVPVGICDVAWSALENKYRYLATSNTLNGSAYGVPAAVGVDDALALAGVLDDWGSVQHGSVGDRFGGNLLSIGANGVAASFSSQPSNYAPQDTFWDSYDSRRETLVDFYSGAYSDIGAAASITDSSGFVDVTGAGDFGLGISIGAVSNRVVYSAYHDKFFVSELTGIRMYDPADRTSEGWEPESCILVPYSGATLGYEDGSPIPSYPGANVFLLPEDPAYIGVIRGAEFAGGWDILKVRIAGNVLTESVLLSEVVSDLCVRAKLETSQIDVTALTDEVDGYVIGNTTPVKDAILALCPAYFFDGAEWGGKINFIKRGGESIITIPDSDLGASESGGSPEEPLLTVRKMDDELPRIVTVKYLNSAARYEVATRVAKRLVGESQNREHPLDLPMVLSDTKAQEVAEVNLHAPWTGRLTYSFTLPRKYSYLTPTDIIEVGGYVVRLVKVTRTADGRLKCEAAQEDRLVYTPTVIVTETVPPEDEVSVVGTTTLVLM